MKAVLMAFHPKWCEKIFSGKKTIEVRKIAPKLETPYKVYVYDTKKAFDITDIYDLSTDVVRKVADGRGKVIGEFVCDKIIGFSTDWINGVSRAPLYIKGTCITGEQLFDYSKGKPLYGLHITAPKLYDTPKELSEFYRRLLDKVLEEGNYDCRKDWNMVCIDYPEMSDLCDDCIFGGRVQLTRPPQSWCYVEEIEE